MLKDGDEFEATSQLEADDLIAVNMARPKKKISALEQPIKTRDLIAVETKTEESTGNDITFDEPVATPLTEKSTYSRRDLRAKR